MRRSADIELGTIRSIYRMTKKQSKQRERDSFTEDGINFWRNPKSPKGMFLAQYRLSDGTKKTIGCSSNEKGKAYGVALRKREKQEQRIAGTDGNRPVTIDELCVLFVAEKKQKGRKPDTVKMIKAMTNRIRGYRLAYCKDEPKVFVRTYEEASGAKVPKLIDGKAFAHELTQEMFDAYIDDMHIKVLKDGTLRTLIGRLRTMYVWAKRKGYATPDIDFEAWNDKVKYSPMRDRKLEDDELDKLLHWLKHESKRGKHNYYRYLFCTEIGLRISEVCSILKDDVDLQARTVRVTRKKRDNSILGEIKITDHLAEELRDYLHGLPKEQEYLFQGKNGGPMKASSEWFRHACKKCKIKETSGRLVLHSARSKFITDQIDEGRSLPKIMGSVGHKRVTTTMRYLQITPHKSQMEAVELSNKRRLAKNARIKELEAELEAVREKLRRETGIDDLVNI